LRSPRQTEMACFIDRAMLTPEKKMSGSLNCPNCGARISLLRSNVPLPPPPLVCKNCGVTLRIGLTRTGLGLLAVVALLWIPFVLVILGKLPGPVVMPLVIIVLVPTVISLRRWGIQARRGRLK
jgi:hypothetical protein